MQIEASELILNPDDSIYHLNILPEDIADTIFLVGDPDRVEEVSRYFDRIEIKKQKREFVTHTGYIGKKRLTCLSTGIGTDNIDIVLTELDALVNMDLKTRIAKTELTALNLIRIGTCGSLQHDIPVDSFLASEYGIGLDGLLGFYNFEVSEEDKQTIPGTHYSDCKKPGCTSRYCQRLRHAVEHGGERYAQRRYTDELRFLWTTGKNSTYCAKR